MILDVLRNASGPVGTHEIVDAILAAGGHGKAAKSAVMPRVRGNLSYLHNRGKIAKIGDGKSTHWKIA